AKDKEKKDEKENKKNKDVRLRPSRPGIGRTTGMASVMLLPLQLLVMAQAPVLPPPQAGAQPDKKDAGKKDPDKKDLDKNDLDKKDEDEKKLPPAQEKDDPLSPLFDRVLGELATRGLTDCDPVARRAALEAIEVMGDKALPYIPQLIRA